MSSAGVDELIDGWEAAWSGKDPGAFDELCARDLHYEDPLTSEPLEVSLKCEPALAEQLRTVHAAVRPGYHLNKRHWNTVTIDGSLPEEVIADMIEDSYDLIASQLSRARQVALGWRPGDA